MTETPKLPHEIEITFNGEKRTIFMPFALLNRCCYLMGNNQNIPLILQDPELREQILIAVLAKRNEKGKVVTSYELDEIDMSVEDIQNLLEFVTNHVVDFTVAAVERSNRVMESQKDRIDQIQKPLSSTPTPNGPVN